MYEHVLNVHVGSSRDVRGLRHYIIDKLEKQHEAWPPACPPLETARLEHKSMSYFSTPILKHIFNFICTLNLKNLDLNLFFYPLFVEVL